MKGAAHQAFVATSTALLVTVLVGLVAGSIFRYQAHLIERDAGIRSSGRLASSPTAHSATKANDFLNSIGVVTHLTNSSYTAINFDSVIKARLAESGIRYIRDTTSTLDGCCGQMFTYSGQLKSLSAIGIKPTVSTYYHILDTNDANETPIYSADSQNRFVRKIRALIKGSASSEASGTVNNTVVQGPSSLVAFSSLNEPDHEPGITDAAWESSFNSIHPTWPTLAVDYSRDLQTALDSDAATASLPIIAPSFVHLPVFSSQTRATLQGLLSYVDRGNAHIYCHKKPPADCVSTHFVPWRDFFAGKTMVLSELGYHNVNGASQNTATSEAASAKYLLQAIPTYFDLGVERTFIYELKDEGGIDRETSFGLLRTDGSPKPAFTAIKNFTNILADSSSNFQSTTLAYSTSGSGSTTHELLLQKASGEHFLLLWADSGTHAMTFTFSAAKVVTPYQPYDSAAAGAATQSSQFTLNVTDSMSVLKIAAVNEAASSGGTNGSGGGSSTKKSGSSATTGGTIEGTSGSGQETTAPAAEEPASPLPGVITQVSNWSAETRVATAASLLLLLTFLIVWTFHHWRFGHHISLRLLFHLKKLR